MGRWRTDDEAMLHLLDAWTDCLARGEYPTTGRLQQATRLSTNRLVALRDRMLRAGLLVLPEALRAHVRAGRGQLPRALR